MAISLAGGRHGCHSLLSDEHYLCAHGTDHKLAVFNICGWGICRDVLPSPNALSHLGGGLQVMQSELFAAHHVPNLPRCADEDGGDI